MPVAHPDLTGRTFGQWTVMSMEGWTVNGKRLVKLRCTCGREYIRRVDRVLHGQSTGCGCEGWGVNKRERHHHGKPAEYGLWAQMRTRCRNPKVKCYPRYGGRGIGVCDRWNKSFKAFISDMGPRPSPLHSIDRVNNDGNYEPSNCRWSTTAEQTNNRRSNCVIEAFGRTQTQMEWSKEFNISQSKLSKRYLAGQEPEHIMAHLVLVGMGLRSRRAFVLLRQEAA